MSHRSDDTNVQAAALERELEVQAEAAKQAIGEYKKAILHRTGVHRLERQRAVELAVAQYMRLRKQLDEIRTRKKASADTAS